MKFLEADCRDIVPRVGNISSLDYRWNQLISGNYAQNATPVLMVKQLYASFVWSSPVSLCLLFALISSLFCMHLSTADVRQLMHLAHCAGCQTRLLKEPFFALMQISSLFNCEASLVVLL